LQDGKHTLVGVFETAKHGLCRRALCNCGIRVGHLLPSGESSVQSDRAKVRGPRLVNNRDVEIMRMGKMPDDLFERPVVIVRLPIEGCVWDLLDKSDDGIVRSLQS
jgi:hypothetical protein